MEDNTKKNHSELKSYKENANSGLSCFSMILICALGIFIAKIFFDGINLTVQPIFDIFSSDNKLTNTKFNEKEITSSENLISIQEKGGIYKFKNPSLAFEVLSQLDTFEELPFEYHQGITYDKLYFGVKRNDKYCKNLLKYFTMNSEEVFKKRNIMLDHKMTSLLRGTVIPKIANDVHPMINPNLPLTSRNYASFDLGLNINMFFVNNGFHFNYYLNKHYGCLNQYYNHIYGATAMNRKSNLALNYQRYSARFPDKPQCRPNFMPESYVLKNHTECQMFFDYLKTDKYQQEKNELGVVFFKKIGRGAHRGEGVFLFDEYEEKNMIAEFNHGSKCAQLNKDLQMQKYIPNPLLLYGHKWDFRVYMLVASTNPLIVYYHDGFLKLSAHLFDRSSSDRAVHLSNTEISKQAFDEARNGGWLGMNETELRAFQTWTYDRLQNYLLKYNYINNTNWIQNSLVPQMKSAMVQIARMSKPMYVARSQSFELFGCDFILDEDLKLWFIEANTSPMMEATTPDRENILIKMLYDHFELMFGLLRSRIKRIIEFVNRVIEEQPEVNIFYDTIILSNFTQIKEEFNRINRNYMELEYEISLDNGFQKIVDENLEGIERYAGYIAPECF